MTKPERLNLAIGKYCFVECAGCYNFFGGSQPDLEALRQTVAVFVKLGIDKVTISGGDPLTVSGITDFIVDIRGYGIQLIKIDTVGTSLISTNLRKTDDFHPNPAQRLRILVDVVDYIGIPLDGWSNETVQLFRTGRKFIYDETIRLLTEIDELNRTPNIVINTVVHKGNYEGLWQILSEMARHRAICHWNIFQYTPTDQVDNNINARYYIDTETYLSICSAILSQFKDIQWAGEHPTVEFRSIESRLGEYLLINSDGNAWLPDNIGNTVFLGNVYGQEMEVLRNWSKKANQIRTSRRKNDFSKLLSLE